MIRSFKLKKSVRGVSMVEMLLVVIVLAVITLIGIRASQQRTTGIMLDTAAGQIRTWLMAGRTFYINQYQNKYNQWPTDATQPFLGYLTGDSTATDPGDLQNNPWGMPIQIDSTQTATAPNFIITTALPSVALAQRLVSLLPNAVLDSDSPLVIHAMISKPSIKAMTMPIPKEKDIYSLVGGEIGFIGTITSSSDTATAKQGILVAIPNCTEMVPNTVPAIVAYPANIRPYIASDTVYKMIIQYNIIPWQAHWPGSSDNYVFGQSDTGYAWQIIFYTDGPPIPYPGYWLMYAQNALSVQTMCVKSAQSTYGYTQGLTIAPVYSGGDAPCSVGYQVDSVIMSACPNPTASGP